MAYAAGANASVTAVTSAATAPVAVVCSSAAPLAIAASDLGATSTGSVNASWAGLDVGFGQGNVLAGLAMAPLSIAGAIPSSQELAVGGNPGNANIAALYDAGGGSVSAFVAEVTVDAAFQVCARCSPHSVRPCLHGKRDGLCLILDSTFPRVCRAAPAVALQSLLRSHSCIRFYCMTEENHTDAAA